jgi:FkbM family methyltransferase
MKRINRLQARLLGAVEQARQNPYFGLPKWAGNSLLATIRERPIICGGTGHWAQDFLRNAAGLNVIAVVDDAFGGREILGLPCLDTDGMLRLAAERPDAICINTGHTDAGYSHFERLGAEFGLRMLDYLQAVRAFGLKTDIRVGDWLKPIVARIDEFLAVGERLADSLSVETLYSVLLYHLETDRDHLLTVNRPGDATYFRSGLFEMRERETYVDCGAFDGDSVQQFIRAAKGRFHAIHAFEPDPQNYPRLVDWLRRESRYSYAQRIHLHQKAVGSATGTIELTSTGDAGACVPLARDVAAAPGVPRSVVDIVTLDEAIREPISLLKLDVEGHEIEILRGALKHLQQDRPRLAICAYHLPGDLVDLPRFVEGLDAGFRIGLRHHSGSRYDTVLYAF